ncbi:hypothetical protein NHH03_04700 [Stieleria sp. TO1_6]|uniref:hypothetical protein n=1 Tax=Stieleria tagensis TaxID=2956795 RepID=UPI00209B648B|nr:hypothetical protein [Stieleria tagensis]MCO8121027.1 hypothetical protein [Stieleria tagensis]
MFVNRITGVGSLRAVSGVILLAVVGGCDSASPTADHSASSPATATRAITTTPMVSAEQPDGPTMTPTEIKDSGTDAIATVLAGRIDAGDMDPFQPGEMAFMLSEMPDEGHAADDPDHADNCPFCAHRLKNAPKAIVQFRGDDGKVLAGDPRQTLGLQKGDVVYVTGSAQYNPAVNTVIVDAASVFRKSD